MKKKKIMIISSIIMSFLLIGIAIYAITTISVIENNKVNLESSDFIISDSNKYYKIIESNEEIGVINVRGNNATYDLLILTKDYSKITNLMVNDNNYGSFTFSNLSDTTLRISFDNSSDNEVYACVIPHDTRNKFVYDYIDLVKLNEVYLTNSDGKNDSTEVGDSLTNDINNYFNIYFMQSVEINKDTILNIPGKYNLLISDIILNNNLSLVHNYGTLTSIDSIEGHIKGDLNTKILIQCLNANLDIKENLIELDNTEINDNMTSNKDELIRNQALSYIDSYIPSFLYDSITLYKNYFMYDISYSYEISEKDTDIFKEFSGIIPRLEGTKEYRIKYTISSSSLNIAETRYKDVKVVGYSDSSLNEYLSYLMTDYLSYIAATDNDKLYVTKSFDLIGLLKRFFKEDGSVSMSLSSIDNIRFKVNGTLLDTLDLSVSYENGAIKYNGQLLDSLALEIKNEIYITSDVTFKIDYNGLDTNSFILSFNGLSEEEKNDILERYITNVYFSTANPIGLPYLNNNEIHLDEEVLFNSSLGLNSLDYGVYLLANSKLDSLKLDGITEETLSSLENEKIRGEYYIKWSKLNEDDLIPTVLKTQTYRVLLSEGYSLAYISSLSYEENTYYLIKDIHIPENGLGGDEYIEYTSSNIFNKYFQDYILQTTDYIFKTEDLQVKLEAKFTSLNGTSFDEDTFSILNGDNPYVTIESQEVNGNNEYRLNVDISNIPKYNSNIGINFRFYALRDDEEIEISSQNYTFTIPGVIRYGSDVISLPLYMSMLSTYGDYKGHLLAVDAAKKVDNFIMSYDDISKMYNNDSSSNITINYLIENGIIENQEYNVSDISLISLTGIEYLANTNSFDISLNSLISIDSLSKLKGLEITSLRLSGVGVTSTMLYDDGNYPLYALNELEELDLSFNNIESINGRYFYRTIKKLNLEDQGDSLNSIKGISSLINLEYLDISFNVIDTFNEIKELPKLKVVKLYGNTSGLNPIFGTNGEANISLYASLYKNVDIYVNENATFNVVANLDDNTHIISGGNVITEDEYLATVIINSLVYNKTYKIEDNTITLPERIYSTTVTNPTAGYNLIILALYLDGVRMEVPSSSTVITVSNVGMMKAVVGISYGERIYSRVLEFEVVR